MAVTISKHPSAVSFAGNPVLLEAYTELSEKTFLKVCAEVTVQLYWLSYPQMEAVHTLSIPTVGNYDKVTFDLSDLLLSALAQNAIERNKTLAGGTATYTAGHAKYSVKVWDEYLDEHSEIVSTKDTASVSSENKIALPGKYTDMQRLIRPEDTDAFLGAACILSNKPDFEAVPLGGMITIPVYAKEAEDVRNTLDGSISMGLHTMYGNSCRWKTFVLPDSVGVGEHSIEWMDLEVPPFFFHVVPQQPFARYFEFVNRYGAVESIYTYGRAKKKTSLKQERQVKRHNTSFRPSSGYVKVTLQEEETLELSTGPISREWAKWFVQEFLTSEQSWMYSEEVDDMIPILIESEEAVSLYDESEAEVLDLPFKVIMCING